MTRGVSGPDRFAGAAPGSSRHDVLDLYEVLEVSPRASKAVIQAAYRALVRSYHPDSNGDSPEVSQRIRQLNAAYRTLSDPEERARYDLETARTRRSERLVQVRPPVVPQSSYASRSREPARHAMPRHDERPPVLNGQIVLGLLAVIAVVLIVVMLLWATFDPDPNDQIIVRPGDSAELFRS